MFWNIIQDLYNIHCIHFISWKRVIENGRSFSTYQDFRVTLLIGCNNLSPVPKLSCLNINCHICHVGSQLSCLSCHVCHVRDVVHVAFFEWHQFCMWSFQHMFKTFTMAVTINWVFENRENAWAMNYCYYVVIAWCIHEYTNQIMHLQHDNYIMQQCMDRICIICI